VVDRFIENLAAMIMDRIETKLLSARKSHLDTKGYIQKVILILTIIG
jgi:hypothetical protein